MTSVRLASGRVYRGVWGVLTTWFRVPEQPPMLPAHANTKVESFRPAAGFLQYLLLPFWILLGVLILAAAVATIATAFESIALAAVVFVCCAAVLGAVAVIGYLAIQLRFDTTWYVLTDRSLRIRRGIWIIREATITYENVQNVKITQGPLQRLFDISNVLVETAGGGGAAAGQAGSGQQMSQHRGLIEGVDNATHIRELILAQLRLSKSSGLGDDEERRSVARAGLGWSGEQLAVLREIRNALRQLATP